MTKEPSTRCLSLSSESESVSSLPGGVGGATDGVGVLVTLADTSGVLASGGEASHFPVLVHALGDPLELGVVADGVVVGVDEDDLEVLVGGVLTNPVGVHDSERAAVSADTLFGDGLESSSELDEDTHVGGLTHGSSLGHWLLSSTSADLDSFTWLNIRRRFFNLSVVAKDPLLDFPGSLFRFMATPLLRNKRVRHRSC